MTKRKIQYWVIPPEADAEFIAAMEEILDTYEAPYDPARPVLCMDEQPVQLHKETRKPDSGNETPPARRVDYEYERCGTACIFMFTEPLSGWREGDGGDLNEPRLIGRWRWQGCWTLATRRPRRSFSSATT